MCIHLCLSRLTDESKAQTTATTSTDRCISMACNNRVSIDALDHPNSFELLKELLLVIRIISKSHRLLLAYSSSCNIILQTGGIVTPAIKQTNPNQPTESIGNLDAQCSLTRHTRTLLLTQPTLSNINNNDTSYEKQSTGCKFYPVGENRRFERVAENLPVGSEIFKLEAHPRSEFRIEPIDNSLSDVNYFKYVDIDDRFVAIKLNQSLEDLVDRVSVASQHNGCLASRARGQLDHLFLLLAILTRTLTSVSLGLPSHGTTI